MTATATKTVRDVVVENPVATRVFENLGIDYCCGGHLPLEEACANAKVSVDDVLQKLERAEADVDARSAANDYTKLTLTELVNHINSTHHVFVRTEVPRIQALLAKVAGKHGENHPELLKVQEIYTGLAEELAAHLMKEEEILFPYVVAVEAAKATGSDARPNTCFGSVQNPVRVMMLEHDNAGEALRSMRELTMNYGLPADACTSFTALYTAIKEFEADLHQHIHLENNILFPRALQLEA